MDAVAWAAARVTHIISCRAKASAGRCISLPPATIMPATRPSSLARSKSRHRSQDSRVFVPDSNTLLLPEGDTGQSTSDLLDVIEPQHEHGQDHTLVEAEDEDASDDELEQLTEPPLPWYKRPSPWWSVSDVAVA